MVAAADPVGQATTVEGGEPATEQVSVGFGIVSAQGGHPADPW